jgi:serine/threonine protein kinase
MGLAPGARVGAYEIVAAIGAGGMGEVYRARDHRLGRDVALKLLSVAVAADPDFARRFEQEARAVAALNHPNVVAVYDVGVAAGRPFLVTELLEGVSLRTRLEQGPVPPRKALEYAIQVARGLAAAHEHGFVHRDLKPENLFVTRDGRVKIIDFGLVRDLNHGAAGPATETASGVVLGTAGYMAPEQVRGRTADARADIFALGAVLYEMLTGQRAFDGETRLERGFAILTREPPELAAAGVEVPPAVSRVLRRCLEKAPADRFMAARDLGFALEALRVTPDGRYAAFSHLVEADQLYVVTGLR